MKKTKQERQWERLQKELFQDIWIDKDHHHHHTHHNSNNNHHNNNSNNSSSSNNNNDNNSSNNSNNNSSNISNNDNNNRQHIVVTTSGYVQSTNATHDNDSIEVPSTVTSSPTMYDSAFYYNLTMNIKDLLFGSPSNTIDNNTIDNDTIDNTTTSSKNISSKSIEEVDNSTHMDVICEEESVLYYWTFEQIHDLIENYPSLGTYAYERTLYICL